MAKLRKQKLKVFRTPIGFHDAFVAAPSQKAALEAWGADANIFAQGIAEEVTDPKLMEEPLARPGEVIKRLRGSAEEHVAALPERKRAPTPSLSLKGRGEKEGGPRPSTSLRTEIKSGMAKKEKPPRPPKPSRDELDAAEEAIEKAEKKQRKAIRKIEEQMQVLERELRALKRKHERERDELSEKRDRARSAHERAMRQWKAGG
jgi:hypothetical protein